MPKQEVVITELSEFEPTRVDGVGKGANGFPILMLKAMGDDKEVCETCEGEGTIMEGNRKCPDCQGDKAGDGAKATAPSDSGATPATDCPTCSGYGKIDNKTKDGLACPDCGGTGKDQAMVNTVELNAVPGFGGSITEGDPMGRETVDKGDADGFRPAPYKPDPDETVQCPKCDRMNDTDAAYCDQCGHELAGDDKVRVGATKGANESLADVMRHDKGHDDWHASHGDPPCKDDADCKRMQAKYEQENATKGMKCAGCEAGNKSGSNYCKKCGMAMKAAMAAADINDLPDSSFAHIEPGGTKDDSGKTVPRSNRHFPIHDAAHVRNALARAGQSDFGDKAMPKIKAAAKKFGIEVGDAAKADGSYSAPNPSIAATTPTTTSGAMLPSATGDDSGAPGSPAWEAVDAATATSAALALMQASEFIRTFAQREAMEVAAGEGNDIFDAHAAEMAMAGVAQALGIMAQLAFHEGQEAQKGQAVKAGKRLAGKTIAALAAARDHLTAVLGNDDPAKQDSDEKEGSAAAKFIATANKSTDTGRDVLDMSEEELQKLVVETVATAVVAAEAAKGKAKDDNVDGIAGGKAANKKSKKKNPKADNADLEDEADHGDNDSGSMDAAKAELTEEEIAAKEAAKAARKEYKAAKKAEKQAAKQAALTKSIEANLTQVVEQNDVLKATVEALRGELDSVKKMAAPSAIVRTRPQEALTKSAEKDALDLEIAKFESLAKSTQEPELRRGYTAKVKELRVQLAAL